MSDYTSTAATVAPVSVSDVKSHLNINIADDDSLLSGYILAATAMLEARANRCFVTQSRTLKMNGFGDNRYVHGRTIMPPRSPLKSVTSISYINSVGTSTTVASSDYVVSTGEKPGRISEAYSATWPATYGQADDVTIVYVAGHSTVASGVPANVQHAIKMVVGHWYRNREAVLVGTVSTEVQMGVDALLESEAVETYG